MRLEGPIKSVEFLESCLKVQQQKKSLTYGRVYFLKA
jgi:hypothetical protein